jgi:hypothetical protein
MMAFDNWDEYDADTEYEDYEAQWKHETYALVAALVLAGLLISWLVFGRYLG